MTYDKLIVNLKCTRLQANHFNQNGAFKTLIPQGKGIAVGMRGNAFTEIGDRTTSFMPGSEDASEDFPRSGVAPTADADRLRAMRRGRESLKNRTGVDFRYDLAAWNAYLLDSPDLSAEFTFEYAWKSVKRRLDERVNDPDRMRLVGICGQD